MKLCKDCKHLQIFVRGRADLGRCAAPQNIKVCPVTGDNIVGKTGFEYAGTLRQGDRHCGKAAKWFEPIRPLVEAYSPAVQSPAKPWWKFWA